jgi:hypothetical protein
MAGSRLVRFERSANDGLGVALRGRDVRTRGVARQLASFRAEVRPLAPMFSPRAGRRTLR